MWRTMLYSTDIQGPEMAIYSISVQRDTVPKDSFNLNLMPIDSIYELYTLEKVPCFPGGEKEMMRYMRDMPIQEGQSTGSKMAASFVVEKDGSITNVKILKAVTVESIEPFKAYLANMPKWEPGQKERKAVRSRFGFSMYVKIE
jgi:periplasmic protein TonB